MAVNIEKGGRSMNYFKSRNIKKSKKNPKSRKHVWKRLLSMVLCAALILGIQPVPQPALAASTYTAAITVDTSDARYYYKDYVEFSETYKKQTLRVVVYLRDYP